MLSKLHQIIMAIACFLGPHILNAHFKTLEGRWRRIALDLFHNNPVS